MQSQTEIQTRIETLDQEIAAAVTSVTVDGTATSVSIAEKRQERDRLLSMLNAQRRRRPPTGTIQLGGF